MPLSDFEDGELPSSPGTADEAEDAPLYCICRTSDTNRFMICCDKCECWFHGDCINTSPEQAKKILKYFCPPCLEKFPDLQIVYKGLSKRKAVFKDSADENEEYRPVKKAKGRRAHDSDDEFTVITKKSSKIKSNTIKPASKRGRKPKEQKVKAPTGNRRTRKSKDERDERTGLIQCFGPQCVHAARSGSKYCSEQCGLNLATERLCVLLPPKLKQWQSIPSEADEINKRQLEKIRQERDIAMNRVEELDRQIAELDQLIAESNSTQPYTEEEATEAEELCENDGDFFVNCVSCGTDIMNRLAMRHMERCFSKHESQSSLVSASKTKIENLFCDAYNAHQRTYCKRLRTLCPEHCKDAKVGDHEVCGFPLVEDVFSETRGKFCRFTKKRCSRHHCWEKIRKALIDMERVQQWLKIDELIEKERVTKRTMADRGGVPGIMLHETRAAD